ncbi:MAG: GSCFA domain-containing protein [Sulfitobacter sp.]|uniref:GSCFA domain-containing protein n=1 Tax=Sulfitobacter sp. TaxID=1903071 RepID=UPI0040598248
MTKPRTPYSSLGNHCFWSRTHHNVPMADVDPVVKGGFKLTPDMKIATAGSCFAQHIARHLQGQGYNYHVTEKLHSVIDPAVARAFGYGVFSARYGNLYTARQLLQLAQRAYGTFTPKESIWDVEGGYVDPFRPNIQPTPFASRQEFEEAQQIHFAAVREMIETADLFVFTFGLTESWVSKEDGAVFPLCPGVAGGEFDDDKHAFHNFSVDEIVSDFEAFAALMRERNPNVKFLMTVSPVPLIATAREDQSVITATSYSKAVLRVAVEQLTNTLSDAFYFPSYEVITGNYNRGAYYGADLREVEMTGVDHVMKLFMKHYTDGVEEPSAKPDKPKAEDTESFAQKMQASLDVICDEEMIEKSF